MRTSSFAKICVLTYKGIKHKMYLKEVKKEKTVYFLENKYLKEVKR